MSRVNIKDLAERINKDTEKFNYFWVYGVLKETKELWQDIKNYRLLSVSSQAICDSVLER